MKLQRIINKSIFYFFKMLITPFVYVNHRIYMRFYNRLLKKAGLNFNGVPRFIAKSARFDDFHSITLGDRVVVSMNVYFLTHDYSFTTALIALGDKPPTDISVLRNIEVGNNVFIGMNTIILPGTKIGDHVIIGAGSVLRGNIPAYSVIAGNPAKTIGDIRKYGEKVKIRANQNLHIDTR